MLHCVSPSPSGLAHLLTRRSEFQNGPTQGISTGDGPERATLQQAIQEVIKDSTSWLPPDSSGWVRPAFTPTLSHEHQLRWRSTGTLLLLHLLVLGNGPEPVSPFLLYLLLTAASLQGSRSLYAEDALIGIGSLYDLDYGTADLLRPWMLLKETDKLTGFAGGRIPFQVMSVQSVLSQCEFQVTSIPLCLKVVSLNHSSTVERCEG